MMDPEFSDALSKRFPTAQALCSAECMGVLTVLALVIWCDTGRMECRHASTPARIDQAHLADIFWRMGSSPRTIVFLLELVTRQMVPLHHPTPQHGRESGDTYHSSVRQGYGEAARAFVHNWIRECASRGGSKGTEVRRTAFSGMWAAYRGVKRRSQPEWDKLVRQGSLATTAS